MAAIAYMSGFTNDQRRNNWPCRPRSAGGGTRAYGGPKLCRERRL